jgi:acyl CoA:acetate/3-ketoacid CoA transferase
MIFLLLSNRPCVCFRAAKICVAEVEEIVEAGQIRPEEVHLPGIFVHRIVKSEKISHFIDKLTTRKLEDVLKADEECPDCKSITNHHVLSYFSPLMVHF